MSRSLKTAPSALGTLAGDIDWIAFTFGPIETVFAQLVHQRPVNTAMLTLTLGKGPIVQCIASTAADNENRAAIELCGEFGMIQFNTHEPILTIARQSGRTSCQTSPLSPPIVERELRRFCEVIAARRKRRAQLDHERHVVGIFDTALSSARAGRAIRVQR